MRIKQSTIDSNVRMSEFKVAVIDLIYSKKFQDVTEREVDLVLHEVLTDRARYLLRDERGKDTED